MPRTVFGAVTIHIDPQRGEVKVEGQKKGIKSIKNISPEDLINCFCSSAKKDVIIKSGFLPANCLSVDIKDKIKTVALWHTPLQCDFTYYSTLYESFPIPRLVFSFDINPSGKVVGYRMAVVEDETPKPTTKLYEYPFSNVYSHTGICIGAANSLPIYKNLHTLASLPSFILALPNNDDNFDRGKNRLNLGYRELLDHLKDKSPSYYYEHILVPRKDGKTLQDFIDRSIEIRTGW